MSIYEFNYAPLSQMLILEQNQIIKSDNISNKIA